MTATEPPSTPVEVELRAVASMILRAAGALSAIEDRLDDLRGHALDDEQRERRDWLLEQQRRARQRHDEAMRRWQRVQERRLRG
jgi:hypothetical protein